MKGKQMRQSKGNYDVSGPYVMQSLTTCVEGPYSCRRKFLTTSAQVDKAYTPKDLCSTVGVVATSAIAGRSIARAVRIKSITIIIPPTEGTGVVTGELVFNDPDQFNTLTHRVSTNSLRAVRLTRAPGRNIAASRWHGSEDSDTIFTMTVPANAIIMIDMEFTMASNDNFCTNYSLTGMAGNFYYLSLSGTTAIV